MSKDQPTALEIILEKLRDHDKEFADLREGQTEIKTQLATHEERSLNQHKRIERVEKVTGGISLAIIVAVLSIVLSGCGFLSGLAPAPTEPLPEPPRWTWFSARLQTPSPCTPQTARGTAPA
jgi:hypothetical protein